MIDHERLVVSETDVMIGSSGGIAGWIEPGERGGRVTLWVIERIRHYGPDDFVVDGLAHFGFHVRNGRYYAIAHQHHRLAAVGNDGRLAWTVGASEVAPGVPNIEAALDYPMFVDTLPDGALVVTNFGSAQLLRVDPAGLTADVLVDGRAIGMADMGNGVVDREGRIWINEVTGCRVWCFDAKGAVLLTLGDGEPGFEPGPASFRSARFSWIYDLRRGPDDRIYVLDSRNYAVRAIEPDDQRVVTIAGTGTPGYSGDGGAAATATFGSDPAASFDGPISLAVDDRRNVFVGDRHNHVIRRIDGASGVISTIAGQPDADDDRTNDDAERDPRRLNLPQISSLDYADGRLYVPTDLSADRGDLVVLRRRS